MQAIDATMGGHVQYLYHKEGEEGDSDNKSHPVIEYLAGGTNALHPDFLEQPSSDFVPPPRIVEFYAPW